MFRSVCIISNKLDILIPNVSALLSMMASTDESFKDLVAYAVEKTLLDIGNQAHQIARDVLEAHDMTFRDCGSRPDVLNFALKDLYGNSYVVLVDMIQKKMLNYQDQKKVSQFIEAII